MQPMSLEEARNRLYKRCTSPAFAGTPEWARGVRVWTDYCTRPNINWRRHSAMCERLLFPEGERE